MIENNRDNYFTKENFEEIRHKFPEFKEWLEQGSTKLAKSRIKQKKIKYEPFLDYPFKICNFSFLFLLISTCIYILQH